MKRVKHYSEKPGGGAMVRGLRRENRAVLSLESAAKAARSRDKALRDRLDVTEERRVREGLEAQLERAHKQFLRAFYRKVGAM